MKTKVKFLILAFIIISSIFFINSTTSRYLSEVNSKSDVDVAIPQLDIEVSNVSKDLMFPGDTKEVEFYIKNYNSTSINEVLMTYYITLDIIDSTIPLNYKIYDITQNNQIELPQTAQGFGPITLNYGIQEDRHYKIVFSWDESDNSATYAGKQFKFNIEVNAIQQI